MLNYGQMLLSKVVDNNDVAALKRFGIEEYHFGTEGERQAYRFITDYAERNRGQAPDFRTVVAECPNFEYQPNVEDSYEFLVRQVKEAAARRMFVELVSGDHSKLVENFDKIGQKDMKKYIEWLQNELERIKMRIDVRFFGTELRTVGEKFLAEYTRRKAGQSFRVWRSKFDFINRAVGGYVSSNVYTIYGKSGRGKSVIALEEAIECAMQGANVLIWSMEMGWFEVWTRIIVSLSGRQGVTTAEVNGVDMRAGFDASAVRHGKLTPEFEQALKEFISNVNNQIPGNITVRAVDDEDFTNRSLRQLEADILQTQADVIVLDPFYYLHYERNTSKTAGGDAAATSMKLRHLAGRTHTVIFAITQAEETKEKRDNDGNRELKLPDREDVKKTKQLLEDAYLLIAVDTDYKQGRGLIGLNKGRDGGEGEVAEILYIPQIGIVRELVTGETAASQFDF